jgi:acetylornithine deacetylase/succinyl-diaminopimelate desuccinylase-like protein
MTAACQRWAANADRGRLCLILTADEEAGGELGASALAASGLLDVEVVVIGEPSGIDEPWEAIHLISRGICCFEVEIQGMQGHSGLSARLPTSAAVAAAKAVLALDALAPSHPSTASYPCEPTVNAGVQLAAGVFYGVHPGHARVACDIRLVPGMSRDVLDREITSALAAALPDDVEWTVTHRADGLGWTPAVEIAADHPVVDAARLACQEVLGRTPPLAAYPGGTDAAAFAIVAGIPCIASLGPGWLSVAHGPNERVALSQVHEATQIYAVLAADHLSRDPAGIAEPP